jgi:hypothetical protein
MLVAWYGAMPGTAARAIFSIAGPLLSLSAASYLAGAFPGSGVPPCVVEADLTQYP